jgi:hypothetical protein
LGGLLKPSSILSQPEEDEAPGAVVAVSAASPLEALMIRRKKERQIENVRNVWKFASFQAGNEKGGIWTVMA